MFAKLAAWIVAAFAGSVGGFLSRILLALGIGYSTYAFAMPAFVAQIQGYFSALPPALVQILGVTKVDVVVTIIFSAIAFRVASRVIWRKV